MASCTAVGRGHPQGRRGCDLVVPEDAQEMIVRAIESTRAFAQRIEQELDAAGGDQEAVVQKIFNEDRRERNLMEMEDRPMLLNLTAQVKAIGERKNRR